MLRGLLAVPGVGFPAFHDFTFCTSTCSASLTTLAHYLVSAFLLLKVCAIAQLRDVFSLNTMYFNLYKN